MIRFLKINVKNQIWLYVIPFVFLIGIVLPYQIPLFCSTDPDLQSRAFNSMQEFLALFAVWNQYLAARFLFYPRYYEVTASLLREKRRFWFGSSLVCTIMCLCPYFALLFFWGHAQPQCFVIALIQCLVISEASRCVIRPLHSAIGGAVIILGYLLLCFAGVVPGYFSVLALGTLPAELGKAWYVRQAVWGVGLFLFL